MKFKTKPYAHQLKAFEKFKDKKYFALFMDMGTGKTKVALDIAVYKYQKKEINAVLIIAPNNVHMQWIAEQLPIHLATDALNFVWESSRSGNKSYKTLLERFITKQTERLKIFAINVEAFQSKKILSIVGQYVKNHNVFIIIDEATRIKNHKALRSRAIHKLNKYGYRAILTGTPTAKSPFDLWSQFEFLKANYFDTNFFIFQHRYGIMMKGSNFKTGITFQTLIDEKTYNIISYKIIKLKEQREKEELTDRDIEALAIICGVSEKNIKFIIDNPSYTRFKRLNELKALIADDVFSVKKEDCLDLPAKIYETIPITMPKNQRQIYDSLKTQLLAEYQDKKVTVLNKIALTTRLMQICGGYFPYTEDDKVKGVMIGEKNIKIEILKNDIEEIGDNEQIIIWGHFVSELEGIYNELKDVYNCRLYYGKTHAIKRKAIIEDFRNYKFKIFIGNPAVAGFGLNLQTAHIQYFFSNSYRTEDRLQAEDRSHRIGVKLPCVYKDLIFKNSIDEKIYRNIKEGKDLNDFFKSKSLEEIFE